MHILLAIVCKYINVNQERISRIGQSKNIYWTF